MDTEVTLGIPVPEIEPFSAQTSLPTIPNPGMVFLIVKTFLTLADDKYMLQVLLIINLCFS